MLALHHVHSASAGDAAQIDAAVGAARDGLVASTLLCA